MSVDDSKGAWAEMLQNSNKPFEDCLESSQNSGHPISCRD